MFNRIIAISVLPDYQLRLKYDDDETVIADFQPVVQQGGVFAPLANPIFFQHALLDTQGRVVQWPGDLEFCADALRLQGSAHEKGNETASVPQTRYINPIVIEDL